jgi:ATP-dependent protease ClpP protease subunit
MMQLVKTNLKADKKFEVVNKSDEVTELYIYDVIDSWYGVAAEDFVKTLRSIETDQIHIRINSPGGDAFDGRAIASAIRAHGSVITAKIDGLCASAATTIANACDHIEMANGSFYMIHRAWTMGFGNSKDFQGLVDFLQQIDDEIAKDYAARTGLGFDEVMAMMDDETWMNAEAALEKGFINEIADENSVENTFDLAVFDKAPKQIGLKQTVEPEPKPKPENNAILARMAEIRVNELRR